MTIKWTTQMVNRLGQAPDKMIAAELGIHPSTICIKRKQLKIPSFNKWKGIKLGSVPDSALARVMGVKGNTVARKRIRGGIAAFQKQRRWTDEQVALLGTAEDAEVAKLVGRKKMAVYYARRSRGIPAYKSNLLDGNQVKLFHENSAIEFSMRLHVYPNGHFMLEIGDKVIGLNVENARKLKALMMSINLPEAARDSVLIETLSECSKACVHLSLLIPLLNAQSPGRSSRRA